MTTLSTVIYLLIALVAANLPWLSERIFFIKRPEGAKSAWMRLFEWLVLYLVVGVVGLGLERRATGEMHSQDWEFFAVTASVFMVFAIPGFIYRYQLRPFLKHGR
jgi:hypothetical protein